MFERADQFDGMLILICEVMECGSTPWALRPILSELGPTERTVYTITSHPPDRSNPRGIAGMCGSIESLSEHQAFIEPESPGFDVP